MQRDNVATFARTAGSSNASGRKILSIRLSSGGLSFYVGMGRAPLGRWPRHFSFAQWGSTVADAVRNIVEDSNDMSGYFSAVEVFIDTQRVLFFNDNHYADTLHREMESERVSLNSSETIASDSLMSAIDPNFGYTMPESGQSGESEELNAGNGASETDSGMEGLGADTLFDNILSDAGSMDGRAAVDFVRRNGIYVSSGEDIALSRPKAGLSAAIVYDAGALAFLREYYGSRVAFYSPMQSCIEMAGRKEFAQRGIVANITDRNIYMLEVASGEQGRQLPRTVVVPCTTGADLVFHICKFAEASGYVRVKTIGASSKIASASKSMVMFDRDGFRLVLFGCGTEPDSDYGTQIASAIKTMRKYFGSQPVIIQ